MLTPRRKSRPPNEFQRVDVSTPLGALLEGVYVPGMDGISHYIDRKGVRNLNAGALTLTKADKPQGRHYADSGTGYVSGNIRGITAFPIVLISAGYFNSGADNWVLSSLNTAGGGGSSQCQITLASSTQINYSLRNNFGTVATVTGTGLTGVTTGTFYVCVAQSRSATDHNLYINGTQYVSATNMGGITHAYSSMIIGGVGTGGTPLLKLNGGVLFAGFGRIALPDDLALRLSKDPTVFWNMFQTPRKFFLADTAAAGGFFARYYYDMSANAGVNSV